MSLKYLLLGLVDIAPMPGYGLMKVFDDSMLFYWHATHTQIYRTLKEMETEGLIAGQVVHQVENPTKKIFSITEKGKQALMSWLEEEPVLLDFKHEFLIKLSFGSKLSDDAMLRQLSRYEKKLKERLTALENEKKNEFMNFSRSQRETELWEMAFENGRMYYQNELLWVDKVKIKIRSEE